MIFNQPAVVLKTVPQREDDLLCDLFTREEGRVWGVARSARKSKKRFGTVLSPLNILQVAYEKKRNSSFVLLREASLEKPLTHLLGDLERLKRGFFFLEAVRALVPEQSPAPQKFDLLCQALQALNQGKEPSQVSSFFEERLLKLSGLSPHFETCVRCGAEKEIYYFVFEEGGVFCRACVPPGKPFEKVQRGKTNHLLLPFLEYCLGRGLQSRQIRDWL